jgi:NADPH2:quinone reductase
MKAVAYKKSLPMSDPKVLEDITVEKPHASGKDILVKVEAISVNPVDAKARQAPGPSRPS